MKILTIEDNERLAERVHRSLTKEHSVDSAHTGDEGLRLISKYHYDLIVLDLNLPDMSGSEICTHVRGTGNDTPILVLTGVSDILTKTTLFTIGADDYLLKPFVSEELLARINALGRRRSRLPPLVTLKYLDMKIDVDKRTVHRAGIAISLRRKEFDILEYLIINQGRILTREMIMNHAWDGNKVSWKSTVDVHIKHLRDKIDRPFSSHIIKTAYGLGYTVEALEDITKDERISYE